MKQTSKAVLWDAVQACSAARSFILNVEFEEFSGSLLLQSAVERQLEILGEALNRLRRVDPELAQSIPELNRVVGMRNIIAHEYGVVDAAIVWSVATTRLEHLEEVLQFLISHR